MTERSTEFQQFFERVKQAVDLFKDIRVAGYGDVMLDKWWHSAVERPNPEDKKGFDLLNPKMTQSAGGAANVAVNVGTLGGSCEFVGVVGKDSEAETLAKILVADTRISFKGILDASRPTTNKTRFYSVKGIARISIESLDDIASETARSCAKAVNETLIQSSAFWVEDYGKGAIERQMVGELVTVRRNYPGIPIIFDPKTGHGACYVSGMCTLLKPNWAEACDLLGVDSVVADRSDVARRLGDKFDCDVLITLGGAGVIVYEKKAGKIVLIPTRAVEDRDVTGAGDTIVAALSLALAVKMTLIEAAVLANCAAGVVVRKQGTASSTAEELLVELDRPETRQIVEKLIRDGHLEIK